MLYEILASEAHNPHYLTKYITFISRCQAKNRSYTEYTERHHICPRAMFPEFTSFSEFPWNCVKLTVRQHFIAHLLLYKAYPGVKSQAQTIYYMNSMSSRKINSKLYANLKLEAIETSKGKVPVKDSNNSTFRVEVTDPRFLSGELVAFSKGKASVRDSKGNTFQVDNTDSRYLSGELTHVNTGKVVVRDVIGNILQVDNTDSRYLSGELVSISKGKVPVKDSSGNSCQVDKTDARYLSGELVPLSKGKMPVRDISGNTFRVEVTDPRFLSGELVGVAKGNVSSRRSLSTSQVQEIRLAIKNPTIVITDDYIISIVNQSQKDRVGKVPFEELKYRGGPISYRSLINKYFVDKFKIDSKTIANIIDGKTYKEITI